MGVNPDMATYNLFAYCGNNPVNCSDPSGYTTVVNDGPEGGEYTLDFFKKPYYKCKVEEYYDYDYSYGDYACDVITAAYDSLEVELGVGGGFGIGIDIGNIGVDANLLRCDLLNFLITDDQLYFRQLLEVGLSCDLIMCELGPKTVTIWDAISGETIVDETSWYRDGSITLCSASGYIMYGGTVSVSWNYDKYSQLVSAAGNRLS